MTRLFDKRRVDVVVVAFGDQPGLQEAVDSCLSSCGVGVSVLVIDNGNCPQVSGLRNHDGLAVIHNASNIGFSRACNQGAGLSTAPVIAFVNPDVSVSADCLSRLFDVITENPSSICTSEIRLKSDPGRVNVTGLSVHATCLAWSGGRPTDISSQAPIQEVLAVSGACMAIASDHFRALNGFNPNFFAYVEDVEICLKNALLGNSSLVAREAIAFHEYEFSKHSSKLMLIDRNRNLLLFSLYHPFTYLLLLPLIVIYDIGFLFTFRKEHSLRNRCSTIIWLCKNSGKLRASRQRLQEDRQISDLELLNLMDGSVAGNQLISIPGLRIEPLIIKYLNIVKRHLARR